MTYRELYRRGVTALENSGCESPEPEMRELMSFCFGISRYSPGLFNDEEPDEEKLRSFERALSLRAEGRPLQYITGNWSFMDVELRVGEGVLIPRDDTEVCVRELLRRLENDCPAEIADLCSGSGAIALALAKRYPRTHITAIELSDKAFEYLTYNINHNGAGNADPVKGNILDLWQDYPEEFFDAVISNPPYIPSGELPSLQKEVLFEPEMALDGGNDGYDFYRIIAERWISRLKSGGYLSLEIGEGQGEYVSALLEKSGMTDIRIIYDLGGLERTVSAVRL